MLSGEIALKNNHYYYYYYLILLLYGKLSVFIMNYKLQNVLPCVIFYLLIFLNVFYINS